MTVSIDGTTVSTTTDDLGSFRLDEVPAGRFFVHVNGFTVSTVTIDGKKVGPSPVDFVIEIGVLRYLEIEDEEMQLIKDSIAESRKKRVICGEFTPLPAR